MKLLYCELCGDIIAPLRANNRARWCICGRHAVWWIDGGRGILRVHDREFADNNGRPVATQRAYILGINNDFLQCPYDIDAETVKAINDACPDTFLFKRIGSPLIRIRPGQSGDTGWASLPLME